MQEVLKVVYPPPPGDSRIKERGMLVGKLELNEED